MVAEIKGRLSLDGKPFIDTLKGVGDKMEKDFGKQLTDIGKKIGAAFAIREVVQFAQEALNAADAIDNMAAQSDLGYEAVQALKVSAEDAGVAFETLRPAINAMRRSVEEAITGNEQYKEAFENLGISIEDLKNQNTEQTFDAITRAMADSNANAETLTASTKVLGAESTRLQGMLIDLGQQGLQNVIDKLKEQNRILDNETVASLDQAQQTYTEFTDSVRNNFITLVAKVIEFGNELRNTDSIEMLEVKGAIKDLEDQIDQMAELHQAAMNEMQDSQNDLESSTDRLTTAQEKYNDALFKGMTEEEQQEVLKRNVATLQEQIAQGATNEAEARERAKQAQEELEAAQVAVTDKQRELKDALEEINRIDKEIADRQDDSTRSRAQLNQKTEDLKQLELERAQALENATTIEAELTGLKTDQAEATTAVNQAQEDINNALADQITAETEIITAKKEIDELNEKAEETTGDIADNEKTTTDKINERIQKRRDEIGELEDMVFTLEGMLETERLTNGESERALELADLLEEAEQRLATAKGQNKEKQEEVTSASVEQLEAVEKLRDIFKVMTEEELDDFVQKLIDIADELSNIQNVPNLDWLDKLSNLGLAGLNETRAKNVKDFLNALVNGINNLPDVKPDAFDFLEALDGIDVGGLTETRGKNVAKFLQAIINGVNQTNTDKLGELVGLLQIIDQLGLSGTNTNISITLPADFQGIPLVFSPDANTTLQSIDGSLKTLEQLKGVVWA
jgi:chromosome segregation ATPase